MPNPFDNVPLAPVTPDFRVENHGSICLLVPLHPRAARWIERTRPEESQTLGPSLVIEPRYVEGVVEAAQAAGFNF